MCNKLFFLMMIINIHVSSVYAQCNVFYHSEINKLDSICSNSGANVQITNNRTRIFLWLLSNSDTKFKYDLSFIPDEPLVIKKAKLQKIIAHLKKKQYVLPKRINSIAKRKLGNSCEIKELPKSKELADSWLASIHFLNPDYGFFNFKSLCEHYINEIKCNSIDNDYYKLTSSDAHVFIGVISLIVNDKYTVQSWKPEYWRIKKAEFERLITWCTNNYSNADAWKVFYNTYCECILSTYLYLK